MVDRLLIGCSAYHENSLLGFIRNEIVRLFEISKLLLSATVRAHQLALYAPPRLPFPVRFVVPLALLP